MNRKSYNTILISVTVLALRCQDKNAHLEMNSTVDIISRVSSGGITEQLKRFSGKDNKARSMREDHPLESVWVGSATTCTKEKLLIIVSKRWRRG